MSSNNSSTARLRCLTVEYENSESGYYDLGLKIGQGSKDLIQAAFPRDATLQQLIKGVNHHPEVLERLNQFDTVLKRTFPNVAAELRGLSDGSGIPYQTVLASNYRKELNIPADRAADRSQHNGKSWIPSNGRIGMNEGSLESGKSEVTDSDKGCTDIHGFFQDFRGWAHNEDYSWPADFKPLVFIKAQRSDGLTWCSVVYPLCIGGMSIGANSNGLVFTVDNLSPVECLNPEDGAVSSQVICRRALEAKDPQDFISIITDQRLATGRGYSYGFVGLNDKPDVYYVETAPRGMHHIEHIKGVPPTCHTNHYIYLDMKQDMHPSSTERMVRFQELKKDIHYPCDMMRVLSDEEHPEWPLYRTGRTPDKGYTDFSALINLTSKQICIYWIKPYDLALTGLIEPEIMIELPHLTIV